MVEVCLFRALGSRSVPDASDMLMTVYRQVRYPVVIIYLVVENVFAKESGKTSPRYLWAWPSGQSMFIFFVKGWVRVRYPVVAKC